MQINLAERFQQDPAAKVAERIFQQCVHCGFCNATCPTYQLCGDERDGPRGRIYLLKQYFESGTANFEMQQHLDRCLTCRGCETTCPSGVHYSRLLEIGRAKIEAELTRKLWQRVKRWSITRFLNSGWLLSLAVVCAQQVKSLLPASFSASIPDKTRPIDPPPLHRHSRRLLMLSGCVQPSLAPNINAAAIRVLDHCGWSTIEISQTHCCGALGLHSAQLAQGKAQARQLIDLWWPVVQSGVEAIVITASGCGVSIRDYVSLFADEPDYAEKAKTISRLTQDLSQLIEAEIKQHPLPSLAAKQVAFHSPCSLQHGFGLKGIVENILKNAGHQVCNVADSHLCCGSAGTYSILQPELSTQLRVNKQRHLMAASPEVIATANIGCQLHLNHGSSVPVMHWVELLAEGLVSSASTGDDLKPCN